ncbi:protease pro-enzyme activation domain-containing protein [Mycobacterium sp. 1274761.0]|uniref:S53 family peptidase n=1 Tax=Mycobacterium sp. 1274761.0 TaxID=1834077 RepID=UPI0007FDBB90|nr:S53 family peptidase [Mycobacterium sp. 1274761.0]OBK71980.1 peptidase S53 [Mycobacterium sp. 1274761.0]
MRRHLPALIATSSLIAVCGLSAGCSPQHTAAVITGPFAALLADSTDLGPSHTGEAQLTATLPDADRPAALMEWADTQHLGVRWRAGDGWAVVEGTAADLAKAFGVPVNDYRGPKGQLFYASPQQPSVPAALGGDVTALGRIMSYTPHRIKQPNHLARDVPKGGLTPHGLLTAYNADPLVREGHTGKGETIVFFEFDRFDQKDLDTFADTSGLPRFTPEVIGGQPEESHGETAMDLQVAHAIAPDAKLVVINARPTLEGDGAYEKIGRMFEDADRRYPGAVWSLSIGWACDSFVNAADLAPVESALAGAQSHGTSAFDATGDNAGLECKGADEWSAPPGPDDVGLDAVSSLPAMTAVGATTLSTGPRSQWLAEYPWFDSPLSQGTSGGVSALFDRPLWQQRLVADRDGNRRRLSPDVAAVGDPISGVRFVFGQNNYVGAGTSQAAPIWAGLTVLMNQYVKAHGGRPLGNINPLLYRVAAGSDLPGFRDVHKGGNAVDLAVPGYDVVTGLGSPNTYNLAQNLLKAQSQVAPG